MIRGEPSLDDIIKILKKWELEASNPRNDGWVQLGYKERIRKVFNESSKVLKKLKIQN